MIHPRSCHANIWICLHILIQGMDRILIHLHVIIQTDKILIPLLLHNSKPRVKTTGASQILIILQYGNGVTKFIFHRLHTVVPRGIVNHINIKILYLTLLYAADTIHNKIPLVIITDHDSNWIHLSLLHSLSIKTVIPLPAFHLLHQPSYLPR